MNRPFYTEFAWAFDLLIDRPVRKECAAIATWFTERGVRPGSTVLDAGCGTGRYALELTRRGYAVHGIDASPEMIAQANRMATDMSGSLSFAVGNLTAISGPKYDGILCRGVLNDLTEPDARRKIFGIFAKNLRAGGVLVFDVREWDATVERKTREPLFRKRVSTQRGLLTFTSITMLDYETRQLNIDEQHVLTSDGGDRSFDYRFVMQCWTRDEVGLWLRKAGFRAPSLFGAYDPQILVGATDRLVAVAKR